MDFILVERKSDDDLAQEIRKILVGQPIGILQSMDIEKRNKILVQLKQITGVTQRQIARVTGISQSIIFKA